MSDMGAEKVPDLADLDEAPEANKSRVTKAGAKSAAATAQWLDVRRNADQRTALHAAAANGHSIVFPEADVVVSSGLAKFYKGGKEIWSCNVSYAAANFEIEKA